MIFFKRVLLLFGAALAALFISGCASKGKPAEDPATPREAISLALATAMVEAAKAPLFKMTCPASGCVMASLEVGNPMGVVAIADALKVASTPVPEPAPWWVQAFSGPLQVLAQAATVKWGLAGVGNIVQAVSHGQYMTAAAGFNSTQQLGASAFASFDSSMRTALQQYGVARPNQSVVIQGDGIVASPNASIVKPSTTYTFGQDGVVGNGSLVKPAPRVCVTSTGAIIACSN